MSCSAEEKAVSAGVRDLRSNFPNGDTWISSLADKEEGATNEVVTKLPGPG